MNLPFFIAHRIYRDNDSGKQVSRPAVLIAMTGIAIGLAVMVIAVLIIAGFKGEMRTKIVGFGSHIQISGLEAVNMYDAVPVVVDDTLMRLVACYPDVKHVQRYSIKPGMVKTDDSFQGMILKGLGQEYDTTFFHKHLLEGRLPQFSDSVSSNEVLVSRSLADKLKLSLSLIHI